VERRPLAVIKGAGDLATGVALRLHRAGFLVVMTEIAQPTPVRRTVAFAEAVYDGSSVVEGVECLLAGEPAEALAVVGTGRVAVLVDPEGTVVPALRPPLLVDAIIAKRNVGTAISDAPAVVALGPGFTAGVDCHAVVETMRGHTLGRVLYEGEAIPNTGIPGEIGGKGAERVIRAPRAGVFEAVRNIGDYVAAGEPVGYVDGEPVRANIEGVLRGLLRSGLAVTPGFKTGDVDPRAEREHCFTASDKALAVGGGVLEAAGALLGGFRLEDPPTR
jgi:xanthine dehydrogenase accessory factor